MSKNSNFYLLIQQISHLNLEQKIGLKKNNDARRTYNTNNET